MSSPNLQAVNVSEAESGIALVTLDMPGSSANVLTTDLFEQLEQTFSSLQVQDHLRGLILMSAKPSIFVAGADLRRINATLDWPDEEIIKFCEDGRAIMSRLSKMPFPTVAAIHGACVGGGLELALWCDYRIASDDRKTILGLPEVKLGLVPGWAGTVRLPRIANLESALDLVTSGKAVKSATALEMGFVDQVCDKQQLIQTAIELITEEDIESSRELRATILQPVERVGNLNALASDYAARIDTNSEVHPHACKIVLEHLIATAPLNHEDAAHSEALAMAKVYGSQPSHGLLNHFFLAEHNKKNPGFVDLSLADRKITSIGIVGVGQMGASIAKSCLQSGMPIVVHDASAEAMKQLQDDLGELASAKNARLLTTEDYRDFGNCDLILECVVEVPEVKKNVLAKIEAAASEQAILATNTSSIPVGKLATDLLRPHQFCGIHFCHPDLMSLVEIIKTDSASPATTANATSWIRSLRKMPVVVHDHAGFVVNRLLAAMLDQAIRLIGQGFEIRSVDQAMREFGFLGGPFEIVDVIGADVCMYAGREMHDAKVNCVTLSPVLPRMVKQGWLGRKSGQGFYRYSSPDAAGIWNEELLSVLESYVNSSNRPDWDTSQIVDSICAAMVLEASYILDDQVVNHPKDIDLCAIHGFAFPAHVGGILFWADRQRIDVVNSILNELGAVDDKLQPSSRLLDMEQNGSLFYESNST